MDHKLLQDGLTAMSAASTTLNGWALAVLGATVAGIIGGEFLRPTGVIRYFYLLFLPGWFFLGLSIRYGELVMRRLAAFAFTSNSETLESIGASMNSEYAAQRGYFELALLVFGCWLAGLLLWWVFGKKDT